MSDDGTAAEPARRGVRMTEDEAWAFLRDGHTGILTTLRRDGSPVALPLWYAAIDGRIYVQTRGAKVARIRNDPRCSFLVESGERWAELRAVHLSCRAEVLEEVPAQLGERIRAEMKRKYAAFRTTHATMPESTRRHYAEVQGAMIELTPVGRALTWDNTLLGLG